LSEIFEAAEATIFLADFASADPAGKINALGVGWQFTPLMQQGLTPGQAVAALIELPRQFVGHQVAVSLTLLDGAGEPVTTPGPSPDQPGQVVRVGQLPVVQMPTDDVAKALLEALLDHYRGGHDARQLRADYEAERKRVDKMLDTLTVINAQVR